MRNDFCVFILTHGRPSNVRTLKQLESSGYTGKVFIVIDDEDSKGDEYRKRFGDKVLTFSKEAIAKVIDEGDNFGDRRAVIYARNACFALAKQVGCRYFLQLDDDYTNFSYRFDSDNRYQPKKVFDLDAVFSSIVDYFSKTPFASIAIAQGGDFIGGGENNMSASAITTSRKAMNTFFCDAERPFEFFGRINDDVNVYTCGQRRGLLFLTLYQVTITQLATQSNPGGMSEMYLEGGTYLKSFYSVMYAPSCVKIRDLRQQLGRLHHVVDWKAAAPQIVRQQHRKADRQ